MFMSNICTLAGPNRVLRYSNSSNETVIGVGYPVQGVSKKGNHLMFYNSYCS